MLGDTLQFINLGQDTLTLKCPARLVGYSAVTFQLGKHDTFTLAPFDTGRFELITHPDTCGRGGGPSVIVDSGKRED